MQGRLPSGSNHQVQGKQTAADTGNIGTLNLSYPQLRSSPKRQCLKCRRTALPSGQKQKRP